MLLLVLAALIEEMAKAAGIYTLFMRDPAFFSWKHLVFACAATATGFLVGEKLLLFATLTQISESIFGSVLFLSLGVLWLPLLLHFACVLIVACSLKVWGKKGLFAGLAALRQCSTAAIICISSWGGSDEGQARYYHRKKRVPGPFSEKTILLAVLLQVFIALFSSFLMVGLTSMYHPAWLSKYSHFRYDVAYTGNETPLLGTWRTARTSGEPDGPLDSG